MAVPAGISRLLWLAALTLALRLWLAAAIPLTGDEAYFYWWGMRPDWGYYDHPPMVGWWLAAQLTLGDGALWLRLSAILQPLLLALLAYLALPHLWPALAAAAQRTRRESVVVLILLAPTHLWNVFITTDTPLVYFSVLSALAWLRAAREQPGDGLRWYALSGVLLAGGVLSKYFIALLGAAYLLDVLRRPSRRRLAGLALTWACCVPALALMAWWNSGNCWPNVMFNFINRNQGAGISWMTPLLYALTLLYMFTPPLLWFGARRLKSGASADAPAADPAMRSLMLLCLAPLAIFALLSLLKTIGMHWLLGFVPLALIAAAVQLPLPRLRTLRRFFYGFAVLHALLIGAIAALPLSTWKTLDIYPGIVLTTQTDAFAQALAADRADTEKNWLLAMDGYSNAATLGYGLRQYLPVFGPGSLHARQDDLNTDFSTLDGRNILIVRKSEPAPDAYSAYFRAVRTERFVVREMPFWRVRGEGFNYAAYREGVLRRVRDKFYRLPDWLPQRACPVCERYFPGEECSR